jgi:hypothetical protein
MNRREYLDKRKEIQQRYEEDLAALDKVLAMFGGTPVGRDQSESSATPSSDWQFDVSKRETVRRAISLIAAAEFTTKSVRRALEIHFPEESKQIEDNQISAIVSWLASKGGVKIKTRKYGSSPAVYEKTMQAEEVIRAKSA